MRHLSLVVLAALGLTGCNGGEDFSDATVPGCPLGAACQVNPRGDIFVEVQGLRVANLGYQCGNSTGFTFGDSEADKEEMEELGIDVPPFHAVCPASADSVEFYLGSALFEGNMVSLGRYLLPQETTTNIYQLTMADLLESPRRVNAEIEESGGTSDVVNRTALLHALDSDGNPNNEIVIPDEAHIFIDTRYDAFVPDAQFNGYASYADFVDAWEEDVIEGIAAQAPSIAGFEDDPENYLIALRQGNDRSRAGSYTFEVALEWLIAKALLDSGSDLDLEQIQNAILGEGGDFQYISLSALVLPNGRLLGGGSGVWATSEEDRVRDYLGFDSNAGLSDILELEDLDSGSPGARILSGNVGGAPENNTDALVSGRFLGTGLYVGVNFEGRTDVRTQFPSADPLQDSEKGRISGALLGQDYNDYGATDENGQSIANPIPFRASKEGLVQSVPNEEKVAQLNGDYWVRLMQACVVEENTEGCTAVPDPTPDDGNNEEAENNYFLAFDQERVREDENGVAGFCLRINAGLVTIGENGDCGNEHTVGFVTRTFSQADGDDSESANIAVRLAPGLDVKGGVAHYNTAVEGRIDLDPEGDGCRRLYRTADENFEARIRARWIESGYLQEIRYPEPESSDEALEKTALASGAVQFFSGAPGGACDPMAP